MQEKEIKRVSKFMSLVLRHRPEVIGLTLDEKGWANVPELIEKMRAKGTNVDFELVQQVVATNNKKRFSFNENETKIRANQGHSISVNLELTPQTPPTILYHGTAVQFVDSIQKNGLQKMKRQHVHLSADLATATAVGRRHGKLFLFTVKALEMHQAGHRFFLSENGVWLTKNVPAQYLEAWKG